MIRYGNEKFNEEQRVIDFIFSELREDESLAFNDAENLEILEALTQIYTDTPEWLNSEDWVQHPNLKIASYAATVFTNEHVLS